MLFDKKIYARELIKATREFQEKKYAWSQHVQLLAASLFGILIALHGSNSDTHLAARLAFALAIVLLALGILLNAITIYGHIDAVGRTRAAFLDEMKAALREHRDVGPVAVPERRLFATCAIAAYTCFVLSLVLLASYVALGVV